MAKEEIVYGHIPGSSIVVPRFGIPQVGVESSFGKPSKLSKYIKLYQRQLVKGPSKEQFVTYHAFPDDIPAQQLFH